MAKRRKLLRWAAGSAGFFTIAFGLFYWWIPWEYDVFPREVPKNHPPVDPDTARLFQKGTKVAVVVAHPDDPEFYIGGLLTRLGKSGAEITVILATDGDKAFYPFEDHERNRRVRKAEQTAATATYGGKVVFLGFSDGRLTANDKVVAAIRAELQKAQPEYVFGFDNLYPPRRSHGDHRRAGDATEEAIKDVPSARWLCRFSTRAPNHWFDITEQWPTKRKLLAVHESQFYGERLTRIEAMVGGRAKEDGRAIGAEYAEGLRCTKLR